MAPIPPLSGFPNILEGICSYLRHPELATMLRVDTGLFDIAGRRLYKNLVVVQTRRTVALPLCTFAHDDYSPTDGGVVPSFRVPLPSPTKLRLLGMVETLDITETAAVRLAVSHFETGSTPLPLPQLDTMIFRGAPHHHYTLDLGGRAKQHLLDIGWEPKTLVVVDTPWAAKRLSAAARACDRRDHEPSMWSSVQQLHFICTLNRKAFMEPFSLWLTVNLDFIAAFPNVRSAQIHYPLTYEGWNGLPPPPDELVLDWYAMDVHSIFGLRSHYLLATALAQAMRQQDEYLSKFPRYLSLLSTYLPLTTGKALRDRAVIDQLVAFAVATGLTTREQELRQSFELLGKFNLPTVKAEAFWKEVADRDTWRRRDQAEHSQGGRWEDVVIEEDWEGERLETEDDESDGED